MVNTKVVLAQISKLPNDLIFEMGKLLSPKELRKSARFRRIEDRRVYIGGRGLLRKLSGEVLSVPGEKFEIYEGTYGKPFFKGYEKTLPFNISNSGDYVALAFDFQYREVGVDVERINYSFDYWDLAGYYFSEKECSMIHSHRDFYRFWTMKEALLKVTGVGLVEDLDKMDLSARQSRVKVRDERLKPFKNKAFTLYTFDNEDIVMTLAITGALMGEPGGGSPKVVNVYFY